MFEWIGCGKGVDMYPTIRQEAIWGGIPPATTHCHYALPRRRHIPSLQILFTLNLRYLPLSDKANEPIEPCEIFIPIDYVSFKILKSYLSLLLLFTLLNACQKALPSSESLALSFLTLSPGHAFHRPPPPSPRDSLPANHLTISTETFFLNM